VRYYKIYRRTAVRRETECGGDEALTHELHSGFFLGLNKKGGSVTNEKNIIRNGGVEKKGKRKQSSDLCSAENRGCGAGQGR